MNVRKCFVDEFSFILNPEKIISLNYRRGTQKLMLAVFNYFFRVRAAEYMILVIFQFVSHQQKDDFG